MATITAVAASRGGQQQPLPHPDTLSPQQLCEWVIQRGHSGPGGWDYLRAGGTGQQQQSRRQETLSPQQLREWVIQRGRPGGGGYVPGGASEFASALGASPSAATGASESDASVDALHTFTLDSGTFHCFFRDCTTVAPLATPVPVSLADPSRGPIVARASTVLPCPAVPSGSLSGLHLPSFSTNLASNVVLQDVWVDTFTPGGQRVAICQVAALSQVSASGQFAASCSCRVLSHQTLLWHHKLGHTSLPCLCSMHSRLLVSGLPRSLPPLPCSPAPSCLPCVEGRQRAAPHSSSFPPTNAPLQTLHMDVWGPAPVSGTDQKHYFLRVVDDFTRYTTVFPLRSKADVSGVLIPWIHATRYSGTFQDLTHTPLDRRGWQCVDVSGLGALSLVCDTTVSKLSPHALRCVFLGFPTDAQTWQFYYPRSRRVFSSQDVTFDELVCFYRLHSYASHPVPLAPLFQVPVPHLVDPLPLQVLEYIT
ncbi:unnamed protein product [Closterium sp. NIES-53]